ncbi:MAG: TetR/AcrR family transcriptional regulator [Deferrisomatales bacterium]|nr:TetR/AcrR family transcriptional regulator [Deferrisomatales bacterium]
MARRKERRAPGNAAGERRRQAMLEAAYALFVERGYETVTVDDIIRVSGGSKSTLYALFGSKEGVMKAVVEALAREMLREIDLAAPLQTTPRDALTRIGNGIAELALSENAINQYRLAVANAKPLPSLARLWYESGPKTTMEGLADYFRKETDEGRLRVENPGRAAAFFLGMIIFKGHLTMSIGAALPGGEELHDIVRGAVDVFLSAYGR